MDEQSREQLLSCLEEVKLDLEELGQHSSAVMVAQAVEAIHGYASKLNHASALTVELQTEVRALRGKLDSARLALRDIMSRSNPQEWAFQRAHEALKDVGFPK